MENKGWREEFDAKFGDYQFILNNVLGNPIGLSPKEIKCLQLRKDGKTLEEVGKEFGVTRERVRQIEVKATERIKIKDEIKAFLASSIHQAIAEDRARVRGKIDKLETDVYAEREYLCISKEEVMDILNKYTK